MTKHSHIIILFLLMSVMAMSCADVKYKHLLADVNSYIRERPDSALVVLRSIDRCDLRSRKLCAEYSLLYAMALDKNYIDTTDVSVVMPAVDYYKRCGSADEKLRSYFYLGRIYQNAGKLDKAAVAYSLSGDLLGFYKFDENVNWIRQRWHIHYQSKKLRSLKMRFKKEFFI